MAYKVLGEPLIYYQLNLIIVNFELEYEINSLKTLIQCSGVVTNSTDPAARCWSASGPFG